MKKLLAFALALSLAIFAFGCGGGGGGKDTYTVFMPDGAPALSMASVMSSGEKIGGKEFDYNSLNSYVLSAIVREVSGESLFSYVERKILKPLGINGAFWEKSPEDIECGGFGL